MTSLGERAQLCSLLKLCLCAKLVINPTSVCGENKGKPEHSSVYVYSIKSICINKDLKLSKKNKNKKNAISVTEELNL